MSGSPVPSEDSSRNEARALLFSLDKVELDRFAVVGNYVRFDNRTRNSLKELKQKIIGSFSAQGLEPENFLIWGAPGSGKSYFLQQIAKSVKGDTQYFEMNLAQSDGSVFRSKLDALKAVQQSVLCFIDEVDSKPDQVWPYETLLPHLEPPEPRIGRTCFVLAGSGGGSLAEMKERISLRPKGSDLLSRIPRGNEFVVGPLGIGDKILVSTTQLLLSAREGGHEVREIEKLALYYIAVSPTFTSARQLRSLAAKCAQRIPLGEDRIRYDYLFSAGDPENKEFWAKSRAVREKLVDVFVRIDAGTLFELETVLPPRNLSARQTSGIQSLAVRRIAVLPLANISQDPNDDYFADGMTEELISAVSKVNELSVISRTSVMQYKNQNKRVIDIGHDLGVGTLLEGSVRKVGNRVRISAQLIDVQSDRHLWAESYDRELEDIFAIQSDIASNVAKALEVQLVAREGQQLQRKGTENTEAYTLYLKGRYFLNGGTLDWLKKALDQFERAIEKDSTYAQAHSGLADSYLLIGRRGDVQPNVAYPKAIEYASKALVLDKGLAEPHATLGAIRQEYEWKWKEAENEFKRAIELNPSYATAHNYYALFLGHVGRFEEGIEEAKRAQELDPLSPRIHSGASEEYLFARKYENAIEAAEKSLEIDPNFGPGHAAIAEALVQKGMYAEAIGEFEQAGKLFGAQAWMGRLGHAHAISGRTAEAMRILDELKSRSTQTPSGNPFLPPAPYASLDIGLVYIGLGDKEQAVNWLEKARDEHTAEVVHFKCEPIYESIRGEARFRELLKSIGLGD
jgi:TolB-like protein